MSDQEQAASKTMPVLEHLSELRRRLIICIVSYVIAFLGAYYFSDQILRLIVAPLLRTPGFGDGLSILKVQEAFVTRIKAALLAGLLGAFPVIAYQVWAFVLPGVTKREAKVGFPLVLFCTVLFVGGMVFAYFGVMPFAFDFFLESARGFAHPHLSLQFYVDFFVRMLVAFGVAFQLPLVVVFLVRLGVVSIDQVKKARRVVRFGRIAGPPWRRLSQRKVPASSAVPNTAGITVEKLSEARSAYSRCVKCSRPR